MPPKQNPPPPSPPPPPPPPFSNAPRQSDNNKLFNFSFQSNALIDSCPLPKSNIHSTNKEMNLLTISAHAMMKLSEYIKRSKKHIEYYHAERMIHFIGIQLKKLEQNDYGIPSFNLDDISVFFIEKSVKQIRPQNMNMNSNISQLTYSSSSKSKNMSIHTPVSVIEDKEQIHILEDPKYDIYFAITNDDKVCSFVSGANEPQSATASATPDQQPAEEEDEYTNNPAKEQYLVIQTPIKSEYTSSSMYQKNKSFISPEFEVFIKTKKIPYPIHFKSGYYSFAMLCIYCLLTKKPIRYENDQNYEKQIENATSITGINELDENVGIQNETDNESGISGDDEMSGGKPNKPNNKTHNKDTHKKGNNEHASLFDILNMIINTKIYWFLIQTLKSNPSERRYICV